MISIQKINESYSCIDADTATLIKLNDFLRVLRPGAFFDPLVKSGFKSPYDYFASVQNGKLLVLNGHIELLKIFNVQQLQQQSDFNIDELNTFLKDIKPVLPFSPHDFQEKAFIESLLNVKQINRCCTSSGKSLIISLIVEFFRRKGKRGLLLVPNINLLQQFKGDIQSYNLTDLYNDTHVIGGGQTVKHFNNSLTISTWQSLANYHNDLSELDYVICDESHRFASLETSAIVKKTINCKYKWGFTGTLPEDPTMKMELIGLFGLPKTYITSRELIDRELATPIHINSIVFNYSEMDKKIFKACSIKIGRAQSAYPQQLTFIKEHQKRAQFITNLTVKLRITGNTLVLFQHTSHGKSMFYDVMKKLYPDVQVENKDITGKKSFEFQLKYNVFFLNGEDDAKTREMTRKILEEHHDATLIANFAILSTGVSIKKLHNMILASPLKSYTTVTQSIGRLMRLHKDKLIANVYDCIDNFGSKKPGGIFYKQYEHRKNTSYNTEQYPIKEVHFNLF